MSKHADISIRADVVSENIVGATLLWARFSASWDFRQGEKRNTYRSNTPQHAAYEDEWKLLETEQESEK